MYYIGSYSNFYHLSLVGEYEKNSKIFLLYDGMQIISVAHNRKNNKTEESGVYRAISSNSNLNSRK